MAYSMSGVKEDALQYRRIYSLYAGFAYMLLFSVILWWLPVAGPAIAGYLGGRKSGNMKSGFIASLAVSGLFIIIAVMLYPFRTGLLAVVDRYVSYGVIPISTSGIVSVSNFATYLYSYAGIAYTFFVIVPSSVAILIVFSLTGGFVSSLRSGEEIASPIEGSEKEEEKIDEEDSKYDYL
ncbi:hypothetical protein [Thermoplasma acidophilum]|nr:hypothetical protein [Thermoplasma acidophilum]MCY0851285.1 hypothetical protein [Thermoplasma acidophilum]